MTSEELRALSLSDLSDGLAGEVFSVAELAAAYGAAPAGAVAAAQARLAGDAPFLCGIPFRGQGLVAENLVRAGAIPLEGEGPAPFRVILDWDGAVLAEPVSFRPTPGLLPRLGGAGKAALTEVPAIRAAEVRDLRRILQPASLRRGEDPDQVPLPPPAPEMRLPCRVGMAVEAALTGYDPHPFAPPWPEFGPAWASGTAGLDMRRRARADWARVFETLPLVALPTESASLVAALGLPAARVGGVILAARWFADERVLTAAALA